MTDLLQDFTSGPLQEYREKATFDWKKLKLFIEDEVILRKKLELWKRMENDPLFHHPLETPSLEEQRRLNLLRTLRFKQWDVLPMYALVEDMRNFIAMTTVLFSYSPSLALTLQMTFNMFQISMLGMGTERHLKYTEACDKNEPEVTGSFALTEISHGTDTKHMRTEARYHPKSETFALHTPDFQAAKCWASGLGKNATHALVYARLITPDGKDHGLHAFVTPVRDPLTLKPFSGVILGDMGEKAGFNGVDNGFAIFNYYHIPRDSLLNRGGDVAPDGTYIGSSKGSGKGQGAALGMLASGRINIIAICSAFMCKAIPIAIRYCTVRRQFGSTTEEEIPVIEYQLTQWRLFPYLAVTFIIKHIGDDLLIKFGEFQIQTISGVNKSETAILGMEFHIIACATKPVIGWVTRDAIQECREACGGHGYLKCAGLHELRSDHDANCTYEGDNNVLVQQTSNWLISLWDKRDDSSVFRTPLCSVFFMEYHQDILRSKWTANSIEESVNLQSLLKAYQWLVCYLTRCSSERLTNNKNLGKDQFTAKNDSQVYFARTLSIAFCEHFMLWRFVKLVESQEEDPAIQAVLSKLAALYGAWSLERHLATMYQGGFVEGPRASELLRESILHLCLQLKPEAVALADALAPPDFVLNSVLGRSDGQVYKHLQNTLFQDPQAFERPSWWQEITKFTSRAKL